MHSCGQWGKTWFLVMGKEILAMAMGCGTAKCHSTSTDEQYLRGSKVTKKGRGFEVNVFLGSKGEQS